jgi:3-oxoacyl-[acyl-carrier-protein] synthase-3
MRYEAVCIEALGYLLPEEIVTTADLEQSLTPLYSRLRLPEGRLELMTGIRERRFWPVGTLPSGPSVASGQLALDAAGLDPRHVGCLIHASVCRDHLEPATASIVHRDLGLSPDCVVYDVSNACLGILNGMVQVANMIELGQIKAGLVVGTESGRALVENTIAALNRDTSLTRESIKHSVASLTIGSASAAVLLVHRDLSQTDNRLLGATARAATEHNDLCRSGRDEAVAEQMLPLMRTDSEALLRQGVAAAKPAFDDFLAAQGWSRDELDKTFCHQVGIAHRRLMFEELALDPVVDFATVEWLGNTGSAALPVTMALGLEQGHVRPGDRIGMLGIGSGINVLMLGAQWQTVPRPVGRVAGDARSSAALARSDRGRSS